MATAPLTRPAGRFLSLVVVLAAASSFAAGTVKTALGAVRVPSADLEFLANVEKGRQTPFSKAAKAMEAELKKSMDAEALAASEKLEALFKSIGIEQDSVTAVVGAISLRSMQTDGPTPKIPGLLAMALKAPVKAADVREAIVKAAAEEGEPVEIEQSTYKDVPMLSLKLDPNDLPADLPPGADKALADAFVAFPADGKVLYFGQGEYVKTAIDRMLAGQSIPRSEGMNNAKALVPDGAEGYLLFDMPDAYRQFMDQQATNAGGNPMAAGPMLALAGLKGAALSSVTTDKAKIALTGDFEADANAIQLKTILDMGLGMVKMQLVNEQGQPMAFANSIKTVAQGTKFALTFDVTIQDLRDFVAFSKRMQQGNMGGGMGAPAGVPAQ